MHDSIFPASAGQKKRVFGKMRLFQKFYCETDEQYAFLYASDAQ